MAAAAAACAGPPPQQHVVATLTQVAARCDPASVLALHCLISLAALSHEVRAGYVAACPTDSAPPLHGLGSCVARACNSRALRVLARVAAGPGGHGGPRRGGHARGAAAGRGGQPGAGAAPGQPEAAAAAGGGGARPRAARRALRPAAARRGRRAAAGLARGVRPGAAGAAGGGVHAAGAAVRHAAVLWRCCGGGRGLLQQLPRPLLLQ